MAYHTVMSSELVLEMRNDLIWPQGAFVVELFNCSNDIINVLLQSTLSINARVVACHRAKVLTYSSYVCVVIRVV